MMVEDTLRAAESPSEAGSTLQAGKRPPKSKQGRRTPQIPPDIAEKVRAAKAGELGHGLKLVAALGDDFESVVRLV